MCEVNPDYKPYVQYETGNKVIYVKFLIEIYGCIESDMLWLNLYVNTFKDLCFSINPYDRCVTNKITDGNQRTIYYMLMTTRCRV